MRRAAAAALALAAALGAGPGCVYYNGMYNAVRASKEAERFERQQRNIEARDRWQRAAIHAESVAVRHPRSRWAEEALIVRGRALVHLEAYSDAATVLERAAREARTPQQRGRALALLGQANVALGRFAMACAQLDSAVAVGGRPEPEALLWRGRAHLGLGETAEALEDFAASADARAPYDRARTLIVRRDTAAALAQLEGLAAATPYREDQWRGALDSLAALGASASVSRLAGRLGARRDLSQGQRARVLLDDGHRGLVRGDTAAARERYRAAAAAAPDSVDGRVAQVRSARLDVPEAASDSALAEIGARLVRFAADGGAPGREAAAVARVLERLGGLGSDSAAPDVRLFLRAELVRDSLGAVPLAARDFAGLARRYPASPWAPKALLAAIAAGHPQSDSLRGVLDALYADSPYRQAALGAGAGVAAAYAALEDSLTRVLAQLAREDARPLERPRGVERPGERPDLGRPAAVRPRGTPTPSAPTAPRAGQRPAETRPRDTGRTPPPPQ